MKKEELELIENFIDKDDPKMQFNESQAIVKMMYELYNKICRPVIVDFDCSGVDLAISKLLKSAENLMKDGSRN